MKRGKLNLFLAFLDKEMVATGQGLSKQEAQQEAARRALEVKKW